MATKFPKTNHLNFRRDMVKRHKLVPHLDRFLITEPEDFQFVYEPKKSDDGWHPSGHCTPPVTELYEGALEAIENLKHTGPKVKRERPASLQKTFLVGHFWHQLLQYACIQLGFATEDSIECAGSRRWDKGPYCWATGSADIAPCVIPGVGDYLIDFKTMNTRDFKTNGMPAWVAEKYEAQINIYLDFFDMERALIVPVQKDSPHEMKEFEFVRNQPLIDAVYEKWEFVSECIAEGKAPSKLDNDSFSLEGLFKGPVAQ